MNNELNVEQKQKKGKGLLIGIITLLIGLVVGGVVTGTVVYNTYAPKDSSNDTIPKESPNKEEKQNDQNENQEKPVDGNEPKEPSTTLNLTGEYEYTYTYTEYDIQETHSLYLYENGNFWYDICEKVCYGFAGNYQVKNDKILLNEIISFGSDAEAYVSSSEKTVEVLNISSKLEIKDEDTTISLAKKDNKVNNQDYYDKLNQRILNTDTSESEYK